MILFLYMKSFLAMCVVIAGLAVLLGMGQKDTWWVNILSFGAIFGGLEFFVESKIDEKKDKLKEEILEEIEAEKE